MSDNKLPSPIYAAAGAGEVGVEQLKKFSAKIGELRDRAKLNERADEARDRAKQGVDTIKHLDRDQLRDIADNAATVIGSKAREAADTARGTYDDLVRRGEHVANGERSPIKVIATVATGHSGDEDTEDKAEADAENIPPEPEPEPAKKTAAKKSTAKKATKKTTAKNSTAK